MNGGRYGRPTALGLGVIGAAFIAWFTHWYEVVIFRNVQEQVLVTSLPPIVFFLVFLVVLIWNPTAANFAPGFSLGRGDLVAVVSMWLMAAAVSFSGGIPMLLHVLGTVQGPVTQTPLMERVGFAGFLEWGRFLSPADAKAYLMGIGRGEEGIGLDQVPWHLWTGPLLFWLPLFGLVVVMAVSLVTLCHRQWSQHERLGYPLADFTNSLLSSSRGGNLPDVFSNRLFWAGFVAIALVLLTNGLNAWFPLFVKIPLSYSHLDLIANFPFLGNYCGREAYSLFRGFFFPFIIAIAVLLPTEISLTCWVGWILMVLGTGVHFLLTAQTLGPTETGVIHFGMYWALAAMMFFVGRSYYWRVIRCALFLRPEGDKTLGGAVLACRIFVVSFAALVAAMVVFGIPVAAALLVASTFSLVVLLVARVTAEIGIPWLVSFGGASTLLPLHFLGNAAASAQGLAVLSVISFILGRSMAYSPAAQATTIGQITTGTTSDKPTRVVGPIVLAVLVAVAVSVVSVLWHNYAHGAQGEANFQSGLSSGLSSMAERMDRLASAGEAAPQGIQPAPKFWGYFMGGAAVIFLVAGMRLRFPWWPLHPLPFLFLNTWVMSRLYLSFLVGWLIKTALIKLAGGNAYIQAKPFFYGIIAGQLVVAFAWVAVGAIYFLITGLQPPPVNLLF